MSKSNPHVDEMLVRIAREKTVGLKPGCGPKLLAQVLNTTPHKLRQDRRRNPKFRRFTKQFFQERFIGARK